MLLKSEMGINFYKICGIFLLGSIGAKIIASKAFHQVLSLQPLTKLALSRYTYLQSFVDMIHLQLQLPFESAIPNIVCQSSMHENTCALDYMSGQGSLSIFLRLYNQCRPIDLSLSKKVRGLTRVFMHRSCSPSTASLRGRSSVDAAAHRLAHGDGTQFSLSAHTCNGHPQGDEEEMQMWPTSPVSHSKREKASPEVSTSLEAS